MSEKKRWEIFVITPLSQYVGTVEAETEEEAITLGWELPAVEQIGSPCHQCTDKLGDPEDPEMVAQTVEESDAR